MLPDVIIVKSEIVDESAEESRKIHQRMGKFMEFMELQKIHEENEIHKCMVNIRNMSNVDDALKALSDAVGL